MSKILVVKSLPEDTTGLLFLDRSDSHASIVEMGEGVSLDNGVLSASGGGGGGSIATLSDVDLGAFFTPTTGDVLLLVGDDWTNYPPAEIVGPIVSARTATILHQELGALDLSSSHINNYIRFEDPSAQTYNLVPDSESGIANTGQFIWGRNAGGVLTLVAGAGVTIIPAADETLIVAPFENFYLVHTGENTWDLAVNR